MADQRRVVNTVSGVFSAIVRASRREALNEEGENRPRTRSQRGLPSLPEEPAPNQVVAATPRRQRSSSTDSQSPPFLTPFAENLDDYALESRSPSGSTATAASNESSHVPDPPSLGGSSEGDPEEANHTLTLDEMTTGSSRTSGTASVALPPWDIPMMVVNLPADFAKEVNLPCRRITRLLARFQNALHEVDKVIALDTLTPEQCKVNLENVVSTKTAAAKALEELCQLADVSVNLSEEQAETFISRVDRFEVMISKVFAKYSTLSEEAIAKLTKERGGGSTGGTMRAPGGAKLPTLSLLKFDGDVKEYMTFRDNFTSQIDRRTDLDDMAKLSYLASCVTGKAEKLLKRFRATSSSYKSVIEAMDKHFGCKQTIIESTFRAIRAIKPSGFSAAAGRDVLDEFIGHLTTLQTMGVPVENGTEAASLLTDFKPKIRTDVINAWHEKCQEKGYGSSGVMPKMSEFLKFVEDKLLAQSQSDYRRLPEEKESSSRGPRSRGNGRSSRRRGTALVGALPAAAKPRNVRKPGRPPRSTRPGGGQLQTSCPRPGTCPQTQRSQGKRSGKCGFCGKDHKSTECSQAKEMTPKERRLALKDGCWRCLAPDHRKGRCALPRTGCGKDSCREDHHRLLHGSFTAFVSK